MHSLTLKIGLICLLLSGFSCKGQSNNSPSAGVGRLQKWSQQIVESSKKIIFIHGFYFDIEDEHGLTLPQMETVCSPKLENLDILGSELFGTKTTELVEYWFYGYNPNQDIDKVADDLISLIGNNSNFDDAQIALVGYSQGGVVAWLIDQRSDLIDGGVILGAPILSTPLAHKDVRDEAMNKIFPVMAPVLIQSFDNLAVGIDQLQVRYMETGTPRSNLLFMAGHIEPPSTDVFTRNVNLVDYLAVNFDSFFGNSSDDRQLIEIGATVIYVSDWQDDPEGCLSDGVVPISSARVSNSNNVQIWEDYDHNDLLSGKGDFNLDKATLQHLGEVLNLFPKFVELDLPLLPELEIHSTSSNDWDWIKFAYVTNGQLFVTDEDWDRKELIYTGQNYYPRFGPDNSLVWTTLDDNNVSVCLWQENDVNQISYDSSWYANFSISGEELVYQEGTDLVIYNKRLGEYRVAIQEVNLMAPPIWVAGKFLSADRIYFLHQEEDKSSSLYSVRSDVNSQQIIGAKMEARNCSVPVVITSYFNGIVVISTIDATHQKIMVISSGLLASSTSIDITHASVDKISITASGIKLGLSQEFQFNSVAFDPEFNHLYIVGRLGSNQGVWLLDINKLLSFDIYEWEDLFYLVLSDVEYLDIKLTD